MDTVSSICRNILYYEVLQKRKVLFDAVVEGLEEFDLFPALHAFPDLFKPLFVASPPCTPQDVWGLIRFEQQCGGDKARIAEWLQRFILNLSEAGV